MEIKKIDYKKAINRISAFISGGVNYQETKSAFGRGKLTAYEQIFDILEEFGINPHG